MNFLILTMQNFLSSFLIGFLFTLSFFLISLFVVIGVKICVLFSLRKNPFYADDKKPEDEPEKKHVRKKRTKLKTLYVDPDEVDRICVKKSS